MQTFFDSVSNATTGLPIEGATVVVNVSGGGAASIFADADGITPASNPLITDTDGFFQFFAADGVYDIIISGPGMGAHTISGIQLVSGGDAASGLATLTTTVNVGSAAAPTAGQVLTATSGTAATWQAPTPIESFIIAASDETTALTAGTAKITLRMPYAFTLTAIPRASLTTAQVSGSIFTVDINESGSSILSTKLTIDNTEKTSTTAATPAVLSDSALANDAEITIDIDQIGSGEAAGLKVILIGHQ